MLIEITPLLQYPEYASLLAFWSYMEWYRERDIPFDTVFRSYKARTAKDKIPYTVMALYNTLPVGMASLKMNDLWSRKDINPWLASVYVVPDLRNSGIGSTLAASIISHGKKLGYDFIYLFLGTYDRINLENFYIKRGWKFKENAVDNDGRPTKIFSYEL